MLGIALLIPITWIDGQHMIIPTGLTWAGSAIGLIGSIFAGGIVRLNLQGTADWSERVLRSGLGWIAGFGILYAIILIGKVLFGRQKTVFETAESWHLKEPESDQEQLQFVVAGEATDWGDMFFRKSDKLLLKGHGLKIDGQAIPCNEVEIRGEEIIADGKSYKIEEIESAEGKTTEVVIPREAMGSGDPHLLAMLGTFFGWQSMLIIIMGSCVTALTAALFARIGLGRALPYGPFLIAGGIIWLCGGWALWDSYVEWARR